MSVKRIASMSLDGKFTDLTQPDTSGKEILTEPQLAAYLKMPYQDIDGVEVPEDRIAECKNSLEITLGNADQNKTVGEVLFDYWGFLEGSAAGWASPQEMSQMCKCYAHAASEMGLTGKMQIPVNMYHRRN